MDDRCNRHGCRQNQGANPCRKREQHQCTACDFGESGEVSEPLTDPNLIEESDPMCVWSRRELFGSEKNEGHGNANAQDPVADLVASLAGMESSNILIVKTTGEEMPEICR